MYFHVFHPEHYTGVETAQQDEKKLHTTLCIHNIIDCSMNQLNI